MEVVITGMALSYTSWGSLDIFIDSLYFPGETLKYQPLDHQSVIQLALEDANPGPEVEIGLISSPKNDLDLDLSFLEKEFTQITVINNPVNSITEAINLADNWLQEKAERVVVIISSSRPGIACVVMALPEHPGTSYARISTPTQPESVLPQVDYVVLSQQINQLDQPNLDHLFTLFDNKNRKLPTVLGGAQNSSPDPLNLVNLMQAALSISHKVIPGSLQELDASLKIPSSELLAIERKSRPWLSRGTEFTRSALLISEMENSENWNYLFLTESENSISAPRIRTRVNSDPLFFPISGADQASLINNLAAMENQLAGNSPLETIALDVYAQYIDVNNQYTCVILGNNREDLILELGHARTGIEGSFKGGKPWSSPKGSYFTAEPQGSSPVAFVYPGAFNSYPGMARELFYSFPDLHNAAHDLIPNLSHSLAEDFLYPYSHINFASDQPEELLAEFYNHPAELIETGISLSVLYTLILDQTFKVSPDIAFGYSLGEVSMLWANGVWQDHDSISKSWQKSALFKSELTGNMDTVRRYWKDYSLGDNFWSSYILKSDTKKVQAACDLEDLVFLTIINNVNEVVIAGEQEACQRVIQEVNCHALPMPFNAAIHNPAMLSSLPDFVELYTNKTKNRDDITFYSAATYQKLSLEADALAESMAKMTCNPFDFSRLVQQAYNDGVRIFIEVGPQKTCSRWIEKILDGKPHAVVPINKKHQPDFHGVLKVISLLVSHQVPLDLSALYPDFPDQQNIHPSKFSMQSTLEPNPEPKILAELHQQKFDDPPIQQQSEISLVPDYFEHLDRVSSDMAQSHQEFLTQQHTLTQNLDRVVKLQAVNQSEEYSLPPISVPLFSRKQIESFTIGDPRECFGTLFNGFEDRRFPRLPNGELQMIDRIIEINGHPERIKVGSTLVSEYDLSAQSWYLPEPNSSLPHVSIMEMALQPCGFLSAYMGSIAGRENQDLYFRNLDGEGTLLSWPDRPGEIMVNKVELLSSSTLEDVIIQNYAYELSLGKIPFFKGSSSFGYFPLPMLDSQAGLDSNQNKRTWHEEHSQSGEWFHPPTSLSTGTNQEIARLPEIKEFWISADGGDFGQGYLYIKRLLSEKAWFYRAHFYQDPVMPGSLGVETMAQALIASATNWGISANENWRIKTGEKISWKYRGQITQDIKEIVIDIHIKSIKQTKKGWEITTNGQLWKGSKRIYQVDNLCLETF